jgi:hypothetical protein
VLSDFDVEGIVILWLSCSGGTCDEELELRSPRPISRRVVPHSVGLGKVVVVKRSRLLGGGELLRDLSGQADQSEHCSARQKNKA